MEFSATCNYCLKTVHGPVDAKGWARVATAHQESCSADMRAKILRLSGECTTKAELNMELRCDITRSEAKREALRATIRWMRDECGYASPVWIKMVNALTADAESNT